MAWQVDGTGWKHVGATARQVWVLDSAHGPAAAFRVTIDDPSKPVHVCIYGDDLLSNCYEVYPTSGTGGNYAIRKVAFGTPGAALATAAHGLITGEPYRITIRIELGVVKLYINNSATPLWSYNTANALANQIRPGMAATVDGARVSKFEACTLETAYAEQAEVFWASIGGSLYASDGAGLRFIGSGLDPTVPTVSGCELGQKAYIVDGTALWIFDAVAMTFTKSTFLLLPNTTGPGLTNAKQAIAFNDRLGLIANNILTWSAIGDPSNFNTGSDIAGRAVAITTGDRAPIVCAFVESNNRVVLLCQNSTWRQTADMALGGEVVRSSDHVGGTGLNCASQVQENLILAHTNEGLCVIRSGGEPMSISRQVLNEVIELGDPSKYTVHVLHDSEFHGTWVFMTTIDAGPSRHIFYSERIGGFSSTRGGFFPVTFPDWMGPTCSTRYQGKVLVGTRDGRILSPDKAATTDAGEAIDSRVMILVAGGQPKLDCDTMIHMLSMVRGHTAGDFSFVLYGAITAERIYKPGDEHRWYMFEGLMDRERQTFLIEQRAAVIGLQVEHSTLGVSWSIDALDWTFSLHPLLQEHRAEPTFTVPSVPTTPEVTPTPPAGGPGDGTMPEPGPCTACEDWMSENTTGNATVGGESYPGYLLGQGLFKPVQLAVAAIRAYIESKNLCELTPGSNWGLVFDWSGSSTPWPPETMGINDFLAIDPGDPAPSGDDYEDLKVKAWFVCEAI